MDTAACGGAQAYATLLAAAKEGKLELPRDVEVWHQSGQAVHLGPHLTTPSTAHLKTTPDLTVTMEEHILVVNHKQVEKDEIRRMEWEADTPDVEETEDDPKEDEEKKNVKKDFEQEKESQEELQEAALKLRQVFVEHSCSDLTGQELRQHFEQFGEVEEVQLSSAPLAPAIVQFQSAVLAESLMGKSHTLQHSVGRGGCVPLRLRGGSGRARRVPPRQQRHNICPFR